MSVVVQLLKAVWGLFWADRLSAFAFSNSPFVIYFI